ncbi:inactive peptidyl-prolyl cis-trans isomerase shutdown-like isoform X1 [Helicoverpa zea]|uniref:inactive peptidyl-prolyl cis-trans isomerase shutdown-like isoform X1 n=1 Tax=Helicoverpa zea TaxID=7113 RepID=UPI001F593F66|nr:inactive peptidyl-prolyl cis-trans isomerase shutdown-like isoform X1 [Helicoverpa zea]
MSSQSLSFMLEDGLNLGDVVTTGSILQINQDYDEYDLTSERRNDEALKIDVLGQPVENFAVFAEKLVAIDKNDYVKKKIIEEGGGQPLHEGCTVSIAYSGYWENALEPFDIVPIKKPMEVDLKDNGLLPGLEMAVNSMLVGETSVFLLSYKVMYGDLGVPPRIKPKADCVFYIKVVRSIITPQKGKINFSEANMFQRVEHEVKLLLSSGITLFHTNNYTAAIQLFRKAINMLHKCRLADENEERRQEKLLKKLYINLVVCYNNVKQPLKACTACNELNRLKSLWNNPKALYQNAKALKMIGEYESAIKRLQRAKELKPDNEEMIAAEYDLLMKAWNDSKESKKKTELLQQAEDEFKKEVDELISNFKSNDSEHQLIIPSSFSPDQIAYFREVCIRENLFISKHDKSEGPCKDEKPSNKENSFEIVMQKTTLGSSSNFVG